VQGGWLPPAVRPNGVVIILPYGKELSSWVSTRDPNQRIVEAADEKALLRDANATLRQAIAAARD
jgi:hypothetical protein